jgi:hypothetical protein
LLYRVVIDYTTSKLKKIARSRFTILCVSKEYITIGVEAIVRARFRVYSNISRAT